MIYLLIILITLLPATSDARSMTLNLDQALWIAMEKNRDIEKSREYSRYVQGKYTEERAAALPQFSLNGTALFSKDESLGIGGLPVQRQFSRSLDITLSQPLYTWGKLSSAIRAAEVGLKTAEEQLRFFQQAAYRDVTVAYYDILLSKDLQHLAEENRSQKLRHLEEVKRKFEAGVATDYDVLAAEVSAENSIPEVIRSENRVKVASERLRFLLALGPNDIDVTGDLASPVEAPQLPSNYEQAIRTAVKNRPEIKDLHHRTAIYNELITIAESENMPRLDLKGAVGWHWASLTNPDPSYYADGSAWNIGLFLTFPFFDGMKTSGKVIQARSDLRTKLIEETKLHDSIALEVHQAEFSWVEAAKILNSLKGTVNQAERLLSMAEKGFELGVKIRLEVDDAQLNLLQAKSNLARAQRDYRTARTGYLWAIGVLGEQSTD
ncbi:MAG: TolC family protein [Desulfuromonadaceae bacterium]|nr:TolC family protein [Desulfuromonadaceae bacterium]MDD2854186.1 TolC family protein [Desulfuromonadaceae bacterium]